MIKQIEIAVAPESVNDELLIKAYAAQKLQVETDNIKSVKLKKRSIDARQRHVVFKLLLDVYINEMAPEADEFIKYNPVKGDRRVIIVGAGPAGLFAALRLIELGVKPVIVERGKDVQARRRDLRAIQQDGVVNPDSNYCFGEGGAGTYSDGKLYTRSTKRGDVGKILRIFVQHGANPDILVDAHPHIGSNKLPGVIKNMRETILAAGGEVHFECRVTRFITGGGKILGVGSEDKEFLGDAVILATGHSARDIYYLCHDSGITVEAKPFALGVRIEHPQTLINAIQYHTKEKHENLPAASYTLACQVEERGVYSFCMCPGGIIVPAATAPGEIVVNGMSLSRRDSPYANSGFVVSVNEKDWAKYEDGSPFAGLKLQQEVERRAFELAGGTQKAPAQRVTDFAAGKVSATLPGTSYIPGLTAAPLHSELPEFVAKALKEALFVFNKKMRGYYTEEAQIVAAESRTSSPVRIPRDKETYMHPMLEGLYPCGEGAGYAGGIVSAAIDGENCASLASARSSLKF